MEEAGCEMLFSTHRIGVMGVDGLLSKILDILNIRKLLYRRFSKEKPLAFVGIDVPDFNLSLERKLKAVGVPCIHYVSPTVWAWRGYRIHKIRDSITHMLTLFPFEEVYYQENQVPVSYVGHPFADEIAVPDREEARKKLNISPDATVIALLPGSRRSEVRRLGRLLLESARDLQKERPDLQFLLPFANERVKREFERVAGSTKGLPIMTLDGQARLAIEAANVAVLASGTVALEAAILRRPHVVVYKLGAFSYWLMRKLKHVDHYSMPNHLLPTPEVPELIQHDATSENVTREVKRYLNQPERVADLELAFEAIHLKLRRDANVQAKNAIAKIAGLS